MSVYIPGMEMPTACYECCMYQADIYYCSAAEQDLDIPYSSEGRCSFCPLVPVPEHGRLIDADALRDNNNELFEINGADGIILAMDVSMIDNAPTIIPADKEGE